MELLVREARLTAFTINLFTGGQKTEEGPAEAAPKPAGKARFKSWEKYERGEKTTAQPLKPRLVGTEKVNKTHKQKKAPLGTTKLANETDQQSSN